MARIPDPRGNRPAWAEDDDDQPPPPRAQRQAASPARGGVEPQPRRRGPSDAPTTTVKRSWIWLAILALLLLGVGIAVGIAVVAKRSDAPIPVQANGGEARLIPSPGPWKARPADPGGATVEGQGQVIYDAGDGGDPGGTIDLDALPEEPVARPGTPAGPTDLLPPGTATPTSRPSTQPAPDSGTPAPAAPPAAAAPPQRQAAAPAPLPPAADVSRSDGGGARAPSSGGSTVQLGAFATEAAARTAWKSFAARFGYLRDLTPVILPVKVEDRTLYRLRATGATDATDVCKRLRVAGETCAVV